MKQISFFFIKFFYSAELAYWEDIDTDEDQKIWTTKGGSVNIHGKVFGCGPGSTIDGYNANTINKNPYKTFSTATMAGFLGAATVRLLKKFSLLKNFEKV